jgi:aminotransferase
MSNEFSKILESIPPSGIRKFFDLVIDAQDIVSLGVGEPDFTTPWNITKHAIDCLEQGFTTYTSNKGLLSCRQAISKYLDKKYSCNYNPEDEIVLTVGVSEAVDIVLRALLNPNDEVILPDPSYVCYAPLIELAYGKTVRIDTSKTNFVLDPKALEKKITSKTKALILCSPNNPTGAVIPKETLLEIAKLAKKHNFWVITDEIYAELIYDQEYVSFASLPGMKERTILLSGFSKAFAMTGWRLGYICAPEEIASRALKIHQYCALCAPIMAQHAACEALEQSEKYIKEMRDSYRLRRNYFIKSLNEIGLETQMPEGAFYCFPSIKNTGLSSEEFALKLIEQEKVAVVPGSVFGLGGEGYIRCCYATNIDVLKTAIEKISRFMQTLKKGDNNV